MSKMHTMRNDRGQHTGFNNAQQSVQSESIPQPSLLLVICHVRCQPALNICEKPKKLNVKRSRRHQHLDHTRVLLGSASLAQGRCPCRVERHDKLSKRRCEREQQDMRPKLGHASPMPPALLSGVHQTRRGTGGERKEMQQAVRQSLQKHPLLADKGRCVSQGLTRAH